MILLVTGVLRRTVVGECQSRLNYIKFKVELHKIREKNEESDDEGLTLESSSS